MDRDHCCEVIEATLLRHLHKSGVPCRTIRKNGCAISFKIPNGKCGINVNLAGLNDNLNFKLLTKKKKIQVTVGEGPLEKTFVGQVHDVGIDFIEIKNKEGKVITLLKDKISSIKAA